MSDASGRLRVLVVEDNPDHAMFTERSLRTLSSVTAIQTASSPGEAIAAVETAPDFHLLVVDYSLPGMNGIQLIDEIRERNCHAPVMLITAVGSESVAAAALRAGVADYVSKSERFWELLPVIARRVLDRSRIARRLDSLEMLMLDVSSSTNSEEIAHRVARASRLLLDGDGAAVWTSEPRRIAATDGSCGGSFRLIEGEVVLVQDGAVVSALDDHSIVVRRLESERDQTMGLVAVSRRGMQELLAEEERVINVFARFAGTAIDNVNLLAAERRRVEDLEQLDRLKSEFISTVSHELLTPLTVVEGFGETLLEHWTSLDDERRRDCVARQLAHARDLSVLIHQILEFSRLERVAPPEPTQTRLLDTLSELLTRPDARRIDVTVSDETVFIAAGSLRSILENLISNALKYSPSDSHVEVTAQADGSWVTISVSDHGVGVHADERTAIFEPFVRGRNVSSARGTGIGLAIVARHVKAAGGHVWMEPRAQGGSVFRVRLPSASTSRSDDGHHDRSEVPASADSA